MVTVGRGIKEQTSINRGRVERADMTSNLPRYPLIGNEYDRRARLQPVLLVAIPVAAAIGLALAHVPDGVLSRIGVGTAVTVTTSVGLMRLLTQFGRDQGKRKEPDLWTSWGGAPTTQMLRHRLNGMSNPVNRDRYHAKLRRLVGQVRLPTAEQEAIDPNGADQVYEACVAFLRNATRDREKFPLIFEENVNYGFRRNLWGMRAAGIASAILGLVATIILAYVAWVNQEPIWTIAAAVAVADTCLLAWWLLRIRPSWVLVPARAYAERLLEACDSL